MTANQRSRTWAAAGVFLLLAAIAAAGCGSNNESIDSHYGRMRGAQGGKSVNGTAVLAGMFENAGKHVTVRTRLSPSLDKYDTVVWAPDDFEPPSDKVRAFLENWLREGYGRTVVYIGRDYDATISYWENVARSAPPAQAAEIARRLAKAKMRHDSNRNNYGSDAEEEFDWFTMRKEQPRRKVESLSGPWSKGIDASKTDVVVQRILDVPKDAVSEDGDSEGDVSQDAAEEESYSEDDDPFDPYSDDDYVNGDDWYGWQEPVQADVLLESEGDPLVLRLSGSDWSQGQIIVVTNGSFLLNLPLVNREHRKLAAKLIDQCDSSEQVAFVRSGPYGLPVREQDPFMEFPDYAQPFTIWPINFILFHLLAVGLLYFFWRFPIFGRPHHLQPAAIADFGKHIDAMAKLLKQTGELAYAKNRVDYYQQTVRRDSGVSHASKSAAERTEAPPATSESQATKEPSPFPPAGRQASNVP